MRLNNLQGLRGIACLLVFVFHIAQLEAHAAPDARPILSPLLSFGFAGVDLFFVLSGFVIDRQSRPATRLPGPAPLANLPNLLDLLVGCGGPVRYPLANPGHAATDPILAARPDRSD
jgi:hypothetical protein